MVILGWEQAGEKGFQLKIDEGCLNLCFHARLYIGTCSLGGSSPVWTRAFKSGGALLGFPNGWKLLSEILCLHELNKLTTKFFCTGICRSSTYDIDNLHIQYCYFLKNKLCYLSFQEIYKTFKYITKLYISLLENYLFLFSKNSNKSKFFCRSNLLKSNGMMNNIVAF